MGIAPYVRAPRHIRVTASFETDPRRLRWTTIMSRVKSVAFYVGLVTVVLLAAIVWPTLAFFASLLPT